MTVATVAQDGAQLAGVITLGKEPTEYAFQYGTTTAYGSWTTPGTATHAGDDSQHRVGVGAALTGLAAGTAYHVRLLAWNDEGGVVSSPATFTTVAAAAGPSPGDPPGDAPEADPEPELGATVALEATDGTVRVRTPGSSGYVSLGDVAALPVGTVVDATRGTVELRSALPDGSTQTGTFRGSRFKIRQGGAGNGLVHLHLRGGNLAACRARAGTSVPASTAAARRKPVRRLWGSDRGGRFRTHGRDSVATVRGTRWNVTDRCRGTVTRVSEGAVDVRVRSNGSVIRVAAGERHFARHRR